MGAYRARVAMAQRLATAAYHADECIAQRLTCNASAHYPCEPMCAMSAPPSSVAEVVPAAAMFLFSLLYAAVQAVMALLACLAIFVLLAVGSIGPMGVFLAALWRRYI